ncbi:MAG: FAD-dependent oxidoreductase [Fervidicoccaceae archaeon]
MEFLTCTELPPPTGKTVSIVGAGPAGLTAAGQLACLGHRVVVYDSNPEPGGMMIFAIPSSRFPKDRVRRGVARLKETGRVEFVLRTFVGRDVRFEELIEKSDAVLVASGSWRTKSPGIRGETLPGVLGALEWLSDYIRLEMGYEPIRYKRPLDELADPVVIIGAGFTALDAALLAGVELGMKTKIVYRRTKWEAPMGHRWALELERRGVEFLELLAPSEVIAGPSGRVEAVRCNEVRLSPPNGKGRSAFFVDESRPVDIEARTVLLATGVVATPPPGLEEAGVRIERDGRIATDHLYRTTRRGVFAAGDVRVGASNVGRAMREGREVAAHIHAFLIGRLEWY